MSASNNGWATVIGLWVLGAVILMTGLFILGGGAYLLILGGSWYFALAGLGLSLAGILLAVRRSEGAMLYLFVFAATVVWALCDVGFAFWPLVSRLFAAAVLAVPVLLLAPALRPNRVWLPTRLALSLAAIAVLALAATVVAALQPTPIVSADGAAAPVAGRSVASVPGGDWPHWGRSPSGTRFAPLAQITRDNVANLKVAWTYRTGDIPKDPAAFVTTLLHVDGKLYGCTQTSQIFAIDAETGQELWRFNPHAEGAFRPRCRGVGYFDGSSVASSSGAGSIATQAAQPCERRVIATTVDARIVEVDAETGAACIDFGNQGVVNLRDGMGEVKPGFYFPTAAPTIVRNLVIVGGLVRDNYEINEPSGVVRAFDVRTGALVWAWDVGNPGRSGAPPAGETYTRATPNVWSTPSFDDALGLVYLPTGNATPDLWGAHRSEADERYSSSIVALDVATGRVRWSFQTVHHDLWDYDVPAQPALYDVPDGHGGPIPALIQTTKRGQIFISTGGPARRSPTSRNELSLSKASSPTITFRRLNPIRRVCLRSAQTG
jgi:quinate dehydrogenase (quinone)